ncbi:MAG: TetR/AcrR family transcriptional regulator [Desulfobacterales bacterium]|nr:TetR/AcrR family transcriptional regulator [Desulfobacterales bacterium]
MSKSSKTENMEEKILSVASRLFSEKGYKTTSLHEIADQVGLHKTSLFHYFKGKDEILMRVMDESLRDHTPALKQILDDPNLTPEEKFRLALKRQVLATCTYKDHINVYLTEAKSLPPRKRERYHRTRKQHEAYFEEIIRQVQKDGKTGLFKGLDPRIVKLGILGMCNWIIVWYKEQGPATPDEIYDAFCSIITGSLFDHLNPMNH